MSLRLEPDQIQVPGQRYALVSFVGPECPQRHERLAMKLRGVFATLEEAGAHARKIQRSGDNIVDIITLEMYNWAVVPPPLAEIEKHEYQEEFLQNLMEGYAASQAQAKQFFEERKQKVMRDGVDAHLLPEERLPPPKPEDAWEGVGPPKSK